MVKKKRKDRLPTPLQISVRCRMLRWLAVRSFPADLVEQIMQFDCPDFFTIHSEYEKGNSVLTIYNKYAPFFIARKEENDTRL